jgi:hypothetical protein
MTFQVQGMLDFSLVQKLLMTLSYALPSEMSLKVQTLLPDGIAPYTISLYSTLDSLSPESDPTKGRRGLVVLTLT